MPKFEILHMLARRNMEINFLGLESARWGGNLPCEGWWSKRMGRLRGAIFHHGGGARKEPISLNRPFRSSMGCFPPVMGRLHQCLDGLFFLWKTPWKTAH